LSLQDSDRMPLVAYLAMLGLRSAPKQQLALTESNGASAASNVRNASTAKPNDIVIDEEGSEHLLRHRPVRSTATVLQLSRGTAKMHLANL